MTTPRFAIYNKSSENMSEVANETVDLAVMDPPFNIGLTYGKEVDDVSHESYLRSMDNVIKETSRVLKPTGLSLILLPALIKKQGRVYDYPETYRGLGEHTGLVLIDYFQFKVTEEDFSCVPMSNLENSATAENGHTQEMRGLVFEKLPQIVRGFPNERKYQYVQREMHPCPFPSKLIKDILDTYFARGNVVLEQFMGTAGLGKEVLKRGGEYRGYETNPDYFKIAQKKLEEAARGKR